MPSWEDIHHLADLAGIGLFLLTMYLVYLASRSPSQSPAAGPTLPDSAERPLAVASVPKSKSRIVTAILAAMSAILTITLFLYAASPTPEPHLANSKKRTLLSNVANMRTLMSAIIIAYTNGDLSTQPLAHDLADVFNRGGIEPVFAFTRPDNPDQTGIIICVKDLNNPPPETEDINGLLTLAVLNSKSRGSRGVALRLVVRLNTLIATL